MKILRLPAVIERTGLSRASIYANSELMASKVKLGPRAAGWPEHKIDAWICARIEQAGAA